jgi:hypothetical protein
VTNLSTARLTTFPQYVRWPFASFWGPKELNDLCIQGLSQLGEHRNCRVLDTALDTAHMSPINFRING